MGDSGAQDADKGLGEDQTLREAHGAISPLCSHCRTACPVKKCA
eukprot:CAMPEP_0174306472 /NCGR_PEP_ID=MMETSP0810-20121108/474_1 /TAXON_ID=73025 ORGANISM="Eutreptiella gymnastica-like, Strain CCMP1594" /NCGR_SAMPLE_ID=MMETSP0810 /ASSEMBLY_ACC=CAM_ASM_000659 /LENGTH=43 /DNA_ID= /DNA_START= /DNA_END= /DNA_ORIENTATION=